jgi:hypothetical protein
MSEATSSLPALLEEGAVGAYLSQIQQARRWLSETGDVGQIADLIERARLAQQVLKIAREAEELGRSVLRLQCEAMRKLAHLHQANLLGKRDATRTARWLGSMTDQDFENLMETCDPWHAATTLYYVHFRKPRQEDRERLRQSRRFGPAPESDDLKEAAKTMLIHLAEQGQNITTASAALSLADEIGLDRDDIDDVQMEGLHEVVRQAIMLEDEQQIVRIGEIEIHCPRFVTYQEPFGEWVRVPWNAALLSQLRFMANFRSRQAVGLTQAAEELQMLAQAAASRQKDVVSDRVSELLGPMEVSN